MVDRERLLSLLARITARLTILDEYAAQDHDALVADRVRMGEPRDLVAGMTRLLGPA